jgi:hypothetical protein
VDQIVPHIRASKFSVVDSEGRPRISLGLEPDGEPSIKLYDKHGDQRVTLGLVDQGADGESVDFTLHMPGDGGEARILVGPGSYASFTVAQGSDDNYSNAGFEVERISGVSHARVDLQESESAATLEVKGGRVRWDVGTEGQSG